jgi:hypothetical protein
MAQDSTNNCNATEYRQFDFWIGDWVVKDSGGTILGHNIISSIEGGCALQENWTGAKGTTGTSLSFYDRNTGGWHQTWIDKNGGAIIMNGHFKEGAMVMLTNPRPTPDGYAQDRTSWRPLESGGVKHIWEQTTDGGVTWKIVFEGYYSPRE